MVELSDYFLQMMGKKKLLENLIIVKKEKDSLVSWQKEGYRQHGQDSEIFVKQNFISEEQVFAQKEGNR